MDPQIGRPYRVGTAMSPQRAHRPHTGLRCPKRNLAADRACPTQWRSTIVILLVSAIALAGCGGAAMSATPTAAPSASTSLTTMAFTGTSTSTAASTVSTSEPTSEIRGCAPQCGTGFADPGRLPIGPYSTTYFFDGQLTVTFDEEWESHEDQSVEFSVAPLGQWDVHRVLFWADIQPIGPDGEPVSGVPITAEGFLGWLQDRPNLDVSDPRSATIGVDQLPAVVVDIRIAPDATNEVSGCPFPVCVDLLTWPNSGAVYGTADTYVLRLYVADVTYGGQTHLFAIGIEGSDTADLEEFLPAAEALIATATAPVSPG